MSINSRQTVGSPCHLPMLKKTADRIAGSPQSSAKFSLHPGIAGISPIGNSSLGSLVVVMMATLIDRQSFPARQPETMRVQAYRI
jgi:hypothetical protein